MQSFDAQGLRMKRHSSQRRDCQLLRAFLRDLCSCHSHTHGHSHSHSLHRQQGSRAHAQPGDSLLTYTYDWAVSGALATLLFGYRGVEGFKVQEFIAGLKQRQHIESLLDKLQAEQK